MSRSFKLSVRLPQVSADTKKKKKWTAVDSTIDVEASSIDELTSALHTTLLRLGLIEPSSISVAIEGVFDGDEDWLPADELDDIPDAAKVSTVVGGLCIGILGI